MMIMLRIIGIVLLTVCSSYAHAQNGIKYLEALYSRNQGHWYNTMTFVQTTESYRNDSLIRKATWYEALKLPNDLRIDFEDPAKGNFVLYKKDSVYRFQNNNLRTVNADTNPFLFFIGGMYYQPFDSVLSYLAAKGYVVDKGYETTWQGAPAYVVGRSNENDTANAVWIDTKNQWIVRIIEKSKGQVLDARLLNHKQLSKGSTETRVEINVNGKLVQVESYDQIKADVPLDDALFNPLTASTAKHWFK
jgi:outer membrane lipoprotein-sorting protein